jgi:hypothetical protein
MSIGDVNSTARGSGARYNDGKPPMELIPLSLIADSLRASDRNGGYHAACLDALGRWQAGGTTAELWRAARCLSLACGDPELDEAWVECAEVFGYGRKKYAEWNWAKGMPWSVPLGCAVRHLFAMMGGELCDHESGYFHRGHFMCNIVMLATFARTYPEGDDRPKGLFEAPDAKAGLAELAAEAQRLGMYDDGLPAESAYLAGFGPNVARAAAQAETSRRRNVLSAEELRGFGDVEPRHVMHAEALRDHDERLNGPEDQL